MRYLSYAAGLGKKARQKLLGATLALNWGANKAYFAAFQDPDQERIQSELRTFFGPRADVYLAVYEKMRAGSARGRMLPFTWNWAVFLTIFPWFFYRRMYAIGATLIVLPIVLEMLLGSTGSAGGMVGVAIFAKPFYVMIALHRLHKADQLGLSGAEREDYLRRAGGVSLTAGIVAGLLFALAVAAAIYTAFAKP